MMILSFDPRKCLTKFQSSLIEARESTAEFSANKLKEEKVEKPVIMTDREKAIYWMGLNQGLIMAEQMMEPAKEFAKLFDDPKNDKKTESGIIL